MEENIIVKSMEMTIWGRSVSVTACSLFAWEGRAEFAYLIAQMASAGNMLDKVRTV